MVRDHEVAGSSPVAPTILLPARGHSLDPGFASVLASWPPRWLSDAPEKDETGSAQG